MIRSERTSWSGFSTGPAIVAAAMLLCSGCAVTSGVQKVAQLESLGPDPRILLMPPDIRYYLITTGGVSEPHAEWTEAARLNFSTAVKAYADERGTALVVLDDADMTPTEISYSELHRAVGTTVLSNYFGPQKLPTKRESFDWSLGPGVLELAKEHDADYALFAFYRDEQASGGRVAFAVLAAAAGAVVPAGREYGFASLVDLHSGDVVWFNVVSAGSGEMRDGTGATAAVATLFRELPTGR